MKKNILKPIIFCAIGAVLFSACGEETPPKEKVEEEVFDEDSPFHAVFDDKIFSIPSPIQMGYLIKKLNLPFDGSYLSKRETVDKYVTEHKQALNLGVYGTDLAYSALYSQKNTSLNYLRTIEKLTEQLGLDAAFNAKFVSEFEKNSGNEDEMVNLMSQAFKKSDNFLKNANRKAVAAKILTGGWIESVYLACQLNAKKSSEEIKGRIADQKQSLESIIELLNEYNDDATNTTLIDELKDLKISFDQIVVDYEYAAPDTNASGRFTTLNNTTEVEFSDELMEEVYMKILNIRNEIVKA